MHFKSLHFHFISFHFGPSLLSMLLIGRRRTSAAAATAGLWPTLADFVILLVASV